MNKNGGYATRTIRHTPLSRYVMRSDSFLKLFYNHKKSIDKWKCNGDWVDFSTLSRKQCIPNDIELYTFHEKMQSEINNIVNEMYASNSFKQINKKNTNIYLDVSSNEKMLLLFLYFYIDSVHDHKSENILTNFRSFMNGIYNQLNIFKMNNEFEKYLERYNSVFKEEINVEKSLKKMLHLEAYIWKPSNIIKSIIYTTIDIISNNFKKNPFNITDSIVKFPGGFERKLLLSYLNIMKKTYGGKSKGFSFRSYSYHSKTNAPIKKDSFLLDASKGILRSYESHMSLYVHKMQIQDKGIVFVPENHITKRIVKEAVTRTGYSNIKNLINTNMHEQPNSRNTLIFDKSNVHVRLNNENVLINSDLFTYNSINQNTTTFGNETRILSASGSNTKNMLELLSKIQGDFINIAVNAEINYGTQDALAICGSIVSFLIQDVPNLKLMWEDTKNEKTNFIQITKTDLFMRKHLQTKIGRFRTKETPLSLQPQIRKQKIATRLKTQRAEFLQSIFDQLPKSPPYLQQ